jgi:hypothetical protein
MTLLSIGELWMHRIGALRSLVYSAIRLSIAELLRILARRWLMPVVLGGVGLLTAAGVMQWEFMFRGLAISAGIGLLLLGGVLWLALLLWPPGALCLLPGLLTLWFACTTEIEAPWPLAYRALALLFGALGAASAWLLLETALHTAERSAWNWRSRVQNAVDALHTKVVEATLGGPFIVFLRYYRTEVPDVLRGHFGAADLQSTRASVVLDYLSRRETATLPIVALHNRREFVRHDNLIVVYATKCNWPAVARRLIENATAIVFMMDTAPRALAETPANEALRDAINEFWTIGGSGGLGREARLIRDGEYLEKTLLVHAEVAAESPECVIHWFDPVAGAHLSDDDLHKRVSELRRVRAHVP